MSFEGLRYTADASAFSSHTTPPLARPTRARDPTRAAGSRVARARGLALCLSRPAHPAHSVPSLSVRAPLSDSRMARSDVLLVAPLAASCGTSPGTPLATGLSQLAGRPGSAKLRAGSAGGLRDRWLRWRVRVARKAPTSKGQSRRPPGRRRTPSRSRPAPFCRATCTRGAASSSSASATEEWCLHGRRVTSCRPSSPAVYQ